MVSFGHKCGQTHGVYTSVAKYENWIREIIKEPRVTPKTQKGLPCKTCCEFLQISGGDLQTSRQGFYQLQSEIEGLVIKISEICGIATSRLFKTRKIYSIHYFSKLITITKAGEKFTNKCTKPKKLIICGFSGAISTYGLSTMKLEKPGASIFKHI